MAGIAGAIGMCIRGFAALVAFGDDFVGYPFTQPLVEDEILAVEFIRKSLFLHLVGIMDDPTFQVKYIFKSAMEHVSGSFLATNAAGAIHDDVLLFVFFHHVYRHRQLLPERIAGDFDGLFKVTYFK